jgi:hypothetical protein
MAHYQEVHGQGEVLAGVGGQPMKAALIKTFIRRVKERAEKIGQKKPEEVEFKLLVVKTRSRATHNWEPSLRQRMVTREAASSSFPFFRRLSICDCMISFSTQCHDKEKCFGPCVSGEKVVVSLLGKRR